MQLQACSMIPQNVTGISDISLMAKKNPSVHDAVIYARYSSHSQRDVSIEQQIGKCTEFARRNGLNIVGIYSDAAMSGKSDKRPQFQQMMRDGESGRFQAVIAWKSNRMGRNMLEAMINDARLADAGVRCLYVEEDFDDTAAGRFALRNMMNVNQFYSENMAEDIRRGLMDNASKCLVNTRPPLGYRKGEDGKFAIDEKTAPIVKEIFQRVLDGDSYADIAADLNRRGVKTAYGREWNKGSFHALVKNDMYTGVYKYADIRIEGGVPAIISLSQFEDVQDYLKHKPNPIGRKPNYADYVLAGKLFCGECGEPMIGLSGTGKHGELHYYYVCQGKRKKLNDCTKSNVNRDEIEQLVISSIREYVLTDEVLDKIVEGYEKFLARLKEDSPLISLQQSLKETKKSIANMLKAIEAGIFTETTKARLLELEQEKNRLEKEIRSQEKAQQYPTGEMMRFYLEQFRSGSENDRELMNEMIETFVHEIWLYDDHLEIHYYYDKTGDKRTIPRKKEGSQNLPSSPLFSILRTPSTLFRENGFFCAIPIAKTRPVM